MRPEPEEILKLVADYYALSPDALMAGRRTLMRTWARHCAVFLLRATGRYSLADIARILHYKDHTSVLGAMETVHRRAAGDPILASQVNQLVEAWRSLEQARYGQTTKR